MECIYLFYTLQLTPKTYQPDLKTMKRAQQSKKVAKKTFKRSSGVHSKNKMHAMRGGYRV